MTDDFFSDELVWSHRLLTEFETICCYHNVDMELPVIRISDSKIRLGLWQPDSRTLSISRYLILTHPWHIVIEVLKHEMAHQYVWEVLKENEGHGPLFRKACARLGVDPGFVRAGGRISPETLASTAKPSPETLKIMNTVEKLFSLAGSDNEHEARLASRKANALIQKHNLDLFKDENQFEYRKAGYLVITHKKKQIQRLQKSILHLLRQFYFVRSVLTKYYDARDQDTYQSIVLFGLQENLKIAEYVYHYLFETGNRLWRSNRSSRGYGRKDQVSFYLGFTQGIKKTLEQSKSDFHTGPEEKKALVAMQHALSVSMEHKIETEINRVFPKTTKQSLRYHYSPLAYNRGFEEGKKTSIKKAIHQKNNTPGRLLPDLR